MLRAYFLNGLYDLFVLRLMYEAYQRVYLRVDRVPQYDRRQQIYEICVLHMLYANFHIQLIESDHSVVHKANKIFNLFYDSFEQSFLLLSMRSVAFTTLCLLHVLLVILEELHSSGDGILSLL